MVSLVYFIVESVHQMKDSLVRYYASNLQPLEQDRENTNVYQLYNEQIKIWLQGNKVGLDKKRIDNLVVPEWLDADKLKRGQKFAAEYYAPIMYSNLITLYLLFAHDRSLRPLIYTKKSGDVEAAFRRYMSTTHRVLSWYKEDLTDPSSSARKHITKVNIYHLSVASKINSLTEEEFHNQTNLEGVKLESVNKSYRRVMKVAKDNGVQKNDYIENEMDSSIHISQSHMAITQFGFMGLIVLYPEKFGIDDVSDMDSFIHLWEYIGYLLGIEDQYNLCIGSVDQVKTNCRGALECILKPSLLRITPRWEHMAVCACKGINHAFNSLSFEGSLTFLLECIDLNIDDYYSKSNFRSKMRFHMTKFLFRMMKNPNVRHRVNEVVLRMLEKQKQFS